MSVAAQVISLAASLILNLIVPKFIDEYQYAYWQIYILYMGYVGILHFGILDGIVLRYSQYDYEELEKPRIRSQFLMLLILDSLITSGIILFASTLSGGVNRSLIILVSLGIVTRNIFTYTSYTFQITNRINKYAVLIIGQRLFYAVGIIALLLFGVRDFSLFCVVDLCADVFGILLGSLFNKGLYFGSVPSLKVIFEETRLNVFAGLPLLIANWASNLLVGSAKMVVQWRWDELVFGKISFAFSVSNLFLNFVAAISVVLFPSLKRMSEEDLPRLYKSARVVTSPILFFMLLFYFPGCWILNLWLPGYAESLVYLGVLLPTIVFSSKVSLLTNNYLKAYRKEKSLFFVNALSVMLGFTLYLLCAYLLNDVILLLISLVLVIMLRSILSEILVMKLINVMYYKEFVLEAALTVGFIFIARYCGLFSGFMAYAILLALYCLMFGKELVSVLRKLGQKV